jgi:uncharacterized protein
LPDTNSTPKLHHPVAALMPRSDHLGLDKHTQFPSRTTACPVHGAVVLRNSSACEPHGGSLVGFYGREGLAAQVGTSPEGSGFSGMVLTYVVRGEARVDEIITDAEKAGATILKPAATLPWGGYGGSFADLDGYVWSIAYSAQGTDQPYAE